MATKELSAATKKAVERVLAQQQGEFKKWTAMAHCAGIAYLSEEIYDAAEKPEEARLTFMKELQAEPWTYASNMKKRLEECELLKANAILEEYK